MRLHISNIVLLAILFFCQTTTKAQEFFNLSAEEVKIDSLLPVFTHSFNLGTTYNDSLYEVVIDYPEFIPMTKTDQLRYHKITTDTLPSMPVVHSYLAVERKRGVLDVSFVPLACRDGVLCKLVSFKLSLRTKAVDNKDTTALNGDKAFDEGGLSHSYTDVFTRSGDNPTRNSATDAAQRYADNSVLASGTWAKIRVPATGVYEITDVFLKKIGFSDPSKVKIYGYGGALVPEKLTGDYLRETDDLKQVPTCTVGGRRLFHAQGPITWKDDNTRIRNPYSNYGHYFLTSNDEEPLTLDSAAFVASFYPCADYYNTLYEVEDFAWYAGGRNLYDSRLLSSSSPLEITLTATPTPHPGYLRVAIIADGQSEVRIEFNDSVVGTVKTLSPTSSYDKAVVASRNVYIPDILASNKVKLSLVSGGSVRLDYIILNNKIPTAAPNLSSDNFAEPEYLHHITNQNHHADSVVDMIIILPTTQKLREQAERLKTLHETRDSMTVRIVPADELFNEFSSGTPDASAYRRYLKMFYDRATDESQIPSYLVLFGDCAWDNRMLSSDWSTASPDDYLLCHESENSYSATKSYVSDDFFCMLDDNEVICDESAISGSYRGKADVAVGRFPVRTMAQAQVMIDKIESYMKNENAGSWQNTLVFMGDDGNNNTHMTDADIVAKAVEAISPAFDTKRVMWDSYNRVSSSTGFSFPDVTNLIKKYMDSGALMMNYSGHGSPYTISHEQVVGLEDFANATGNCLPLWFTASCDIMPFDGQEATIGETALLNEKGGAVAFVGTTRTVYSHQNRMINLAFTKLVVDPSKKLSIGEALRQAKNQLVNSSEDLTINKLHYALLGDPALKLTLPQQKVVIDSINGQFLDGEDLLTMKAGELITVTGHIEDDGLLVSDFTGMMTAIVNDAKRTVVCHLHDTSDEGAEEAFTYRDYSGTIYTGKDSIRAGRFSFSFVVPKDISYAYGAGSIKIHAVSSDKKRSATGSTSCVSFNGSSSFKTDSIGPAIYCYLNSSSFSNGDAVNATPYFIAELSDEDGINAAGSGIGHDMQLIIDGDPSKTYTLNDNFNFDFGSYQSGTLGFSIPTLEEGEHKLLFRAWDVLNNSSTSELTFVVSNSVAPQLFDVECIKNPAVSSTSFRIVHDRIGDNLDVEIEIFDMAGRHLGTHAVSGVSGSNTFIVDWDLTINGGRPLGTGVYLYRVNISSDSSKQASKTKKLIVLSNK